MHPVHVNRFKRQNALTSPSHHLLQSEKGLIKAPFASTGTLCHIISAFQIPHLWVHCEAFYTDGWQFPLVSSFQPMCICHTHMTRRCVLKWTSVFAFEMHETHTHTPTFILTTLSLFSVSHKHTAVKAALTSASAKRSRQPRQSK